MPPDPKGEAETLQWTISALNSVEMVTVPWWFIGLRTIRSKIGCCSLQHLNPVLADREWLAAGQFTVADILMADALRVPKVRRAGDFPALRAYVDRPSFQRAYQAQLAHFAKADP